MKTEVKVIIISGIVTIIVAIINGNDNIHAGGNVTMHGAKK